MTACIVPQALSLLMMKVKLKIPLNLVFFYFSNLMKTTQEDNSMKVFEANTVSYDWREFLKKSLKRGWVCDVIHLH